MFIALRQLLHTTLVLSSAAMVACGGGKEPTLTVFTELNSNKIYSVADDGTPIYVPYPGPGDSNIAEATLNAAGVRTSNRLCTSGSSRTSSGAYLDSVNGFTPIYIIFDIPESDLAKAQAVYYRRYFPEFSLVKPFWDCVASGY